MLAIFLGIGHTVLAVLMVVNTCDPMNSLAAQPKRQSIA